MEWEAAESYNYISYLELQAQCNIYFILHNLVQLAHLSLTEKGCIGHRCKQRSTKHIYSMLIVGQWPLVAANRKSFHKIVENKLEADKIGVPGVPGRTRKRCNKIGVSVKKNKCFFSGKAGICKSGRCDTAVTASPIFVTAVCCCSVMPIPVSELMSSVHWASNSNHPKP